jgi:hypothetical protein
MHKRRFVLTHRPQQLHVRVSVRLHGQRMRDPHGPVPLRPLLQRLHVHAEKDPIRVYMRVRLLRTTLQRANQSMPLLPVRQRPVRQPGHFVRV